MNCYAAKFLSIFWMTSFALGLEYEFKNINNRIKRAESRDESSAASSDIQALDSRCNSERLRSIMKLASGNDATTLKRSIQALAEQRLQARYNVICAEDDFSYITNTEEYCQETLAGGRTCYAFRQLSRFASTTSIALRQRKRLRKFLAHKQ